MMVLSMAVPKTTLAVRYAMCDLCGLCPIIENGANPSCGFGENKAKIIPGDWANCVKCLYPDLYAAGSTPDPESTDPKCATLIINDNVSSPKYNLPEFPAKVGRQYTMLGCISSGTGFTGQTGAPSVVQKLLNVIFSLSGGLAFLYLMYGAFIILTSQADPERLNYGRRLVYGAIVGLIITLGSVFMVNIIGSGILRIPGFNGSI